MNVNIYSLVGNTLGQFVLLELIGSGGMGAVYLADQPCLKRRVAIKVMSPDVAAQPDYLRRFNREAHTAASLEHPNIVHLYDYGTENGVSFLAMQLLSGGTLSQRIRPSADAEPCLWPLSEVADLLRQLASALDYAHSMKIIHRDIKPNNIMFDQHGNACLVDFGIAKPLEATSSLTATHTTLGTPAFMAPEQWRAEPPTPTTDQYALGIVAYLLVSGKAPFEAPTPFGLMHRHLNDTAAPVHTCRSDIPSEVSQVIERSIAKSASERFPSITAFAEAFAQALPNALSAAFVRRTVEPAIGSAAPVMAQEDTESGRSTGQIDVLVELEQDSQITNICVPSGDTTNLVDANANTAWPSFLDPSPAVSISAPRPAEPPASTVAHPKQKRQISLLWLLLIAGLVVPLALLFQDILHSEETYGVTALTKPQSPGNLPPQNVPTATPTRVVRKASPTPAAPRPVAAAVQATPVPRVAQCRSDLPSRLSHGAQGRVTPGQPNSLRVSPSTGSQRVGTIPAGAVFDVLDGPECAQGYVWWQVRFEGQTGWTAEGGAGEYWLEPHTDSWQPAARSSNTCGNRATRFSIGETVVVSRIGDGLRILTEAGGGAHNALAQGVPGDRLKIQSGPVCGHLTAYAQPSWYWYVYAYSDQLSGWVAEGPTTEQWICPLNDSQCLPW